MKCNLRHLKTKKPILCIATGFALLFCFHIVSYHFDFHNIPGHTRSLEIQTNSLNHFLFIFEKRQVPLLLFDSVILHEILHQDNQTDWRRYISIWKKIYKFQPKRKKFTSFAILASKFKDKHEAIIKDLQARGFFVHVSLSVDPKLLPANNSDEYIPTYLWMAKDGHVIHIAILHERLNSYFWVGPIMSNDWKTVVNTLAPAFGNNRQNIETIRAEIPTHAQALDKSNRFLGWPLYVNGYKVTVPFRIRAFLDEHRNSRFIECDHERAKKFKEMYEKSLTKENLEFKTLAKKMILNAKTVLDEIKMPFWLSSGTCLGWYRQCDIIPYSIDVDLEVFIQDYNIDMFRKLRNAHFEIMHVFGKLNDGFEIAFLGEDGMKLDIFFVYEGVDHFWVGGLKADDGQKYKYKFPKFKLCWTEFLDMKVRVPCDPQKYIEASYGQHWMIPRKNWTWHKSPPNLETDGKMNATEKKEAIIVNNNVLHRLHDYSETKTKGK